jgi:hypothetical protein
MHPAKNIITLISVLFLFTVASAQVTVTGHVCAEIVEAVSATSGTNNLLSLQQNAAPENLDLGSFTLSGGSNAICSVVVNSTQLTGENGNMVAFTADPSLSNNTGFLNDRGTQVFSFKGNAGNEILSSNDKQYEGQYNVVFAYN